MTRRFERVENSVEIYRFPALDALGFRTFVTGRGGGVSAPPFDSLNVDPGGGDDPANIEENLRRIKEALSLEILWTPRQVHGDGIAVIDSGGGGEPPPADIEADAVVVSSPGIAIGVKTADCLPILMADPERKVAAAVHAGRRGSELYIARRAAETMVKRFGCEPGAITAALGPCVRECCYEVDVASARRFRACCGGSGSRMVDLVGANVRQLLDAGLLEENIIDSGVCVSCESGRFFSHRKDRGRTGRFVSGLAVRT